MRKPKGHVAVLIRSDGVLMADASCFDRCPAAGVKTSEWQPGEARRNLAHATLKALCHDDIAFVIRGYDASKVLDALCREKGYRIEVFPVGGDEDAP